MCILEGSVMRRLPIEVIMWLFMKLTAREHAEHRGLLDFEAPWPVILLVHYNVYQRFGVSMSQRACFCICCWAFSLCFAVW